MPNHLVVIAGPTAVGKTALSIEIAKHFKTAIISADSRQFFKEISIGTAKPSKKELEACSHHLIGHISIKDMYTAAQFEQDALQCCEQLFKQHSIIILTGGSGLYIDALCKGFDEAPHADVAIRNELEEQYKQKGIELLQQTIKVLDPEYAQIVDIHNPQRLMRAIEMIRVSGKKMNELRTGVPKKRAFNIIKICLSGNREALYDGINKRVDKMIANNLEDEALAFYHLKHLNALQTVGYKEFFDYFEGKLSHAETVEKIKQNTRNYAKRQLTWFRRDKSYQWFELPQEKKLIIPYIEQQLSLQKQ